MKVYSTCLVGGNFYRVVNLGDSYGHNVRDISDKDGDLDVAPGGEGHTCAERLIRESQAGRLQGFDLPY